MKNLTNLVPDGRDFMVDTENPHLITSTDLAHFSRIGILTQRFMAATMNGLKNNPGPVNVLFSGLRHCYKRLGLMHHERCPILTRLDLMLDTDGKWRIAEVDPSNKHGLGIGLAVRNESGAGDRQKLIPLLAPYITDNLFIVLADKEASFWVREQRYFADALQRATGKEVTVITESKYVEKIRGGLILDFPFCDTARGRVILGDIFEKTPERFVNPPRHMLGGKTLMTLPFQHAEWLVSAGMSAEDMASIKEYLPLTFAGPFVVKEAYSSGARGVSFHGNNDVPVVCQAFIPQCPVRKPEGTRFMRLACYYVGEQLTEIIATATPDLPVHCGKGAINYHVNVAA